MKWIVVQKPLRDGFQVFRRAWPEDTYIMNDEDGWTNVFTSAYPDGYDYFGPSPEDESADDWAATGPSGE